MSSVVTGAKTGTAPSDFAVPKKQKKTSKAGRILRRILLAALIMAAAAVIAVYVGYSIFYSTHFFPNTTVNGIEVSGEEVREVKQQIASEIEKYDLTVVTKEGNEEIIDGKDFGLAAVFGMSFWRSWRPRTALPGRCISSGKSRKRSVLWWTSAPPSFRTA